MAKKIFIEIRLGNLCDMFLKGMSKSLKYTWRSLMYQFKIGLKLFNGLFVNTK